jgi:hypothetical protein
MLLMIISALKSNKSMCGNMVKEIIQDIEKLNNNKIINTCSKNQVKNSNLLKFKTGL